MAAARKRQQKWRPHRDWGRGIALLLCVVFAIIGAVPLSLGLLVRTTLVRAWAARETAAMLKRTLKVKAHYDVAVQAWPMLIALENVVVDASDGGDPFLSVERIAVRPRPFSLLAGRIDAGDVEIVGPRVRVVVKDRKIQNLSFELPDSKPSEGAPFASLAVTDARVDATVDGVKLATRELDVDLSAEDEGAFEIALRTGETTVTRVRQVMERETEDAVDDDVICRAEARVRLQGRSVLVRRLSLEGSADFDPDPGTRPSCHLRETDWRAVEIRLGALHVDAPEGGPVRAGGRVHARVPAALVHRFKKIAHTSGSVTVDLEVDYDGKEAVPFGHALPHIEGHIGADRPGIDGKIFGKRIDLDVSTTPTALRVTKLTSLWADGKVSIGEVTIEPFTEGIPITTGPISLEGLEMTGLLRDLGAHPRAHVAWTLDKGRFEGLKGHLSPPLIEGPLTVQTHGFEIFDRPAVEPSRRHMMGVKEGTVRCNFVVNGTPGTPLPGVVISSAAIDTPRSHLDASVVLGFNSVIDIEVREGSRVDLAEIAPLGDIPISGVVALRARGHGAFDHPKLTGEVKITDFNFANLPVGDVESPRVAFEPLVLDLFDARLRHNGSRVRSSQIRLAFDKGATVIADADVDTTEAPGLKIRDLFEVFHFEKDPRFADISAAALGKGRVHYVLGGHEDHCGGGLLSVQTSMDLADVGLMGERFDGGTVDVDVLWDDFAAGSSGMKIDLHSATLRKGDGSVLVSAAVQPGGALKGNVIVSGVPLARLDALGKASKLFDGTASMVAGLSGTISAMEMNADVNLSRLRIGPSTLGPSHLRVAMLSNPVPSRGLTQCHHPRGGAFDQGEYDKDLSDGDFKIDGALFDGQVALDDLRITRQRRKVLKGKVSAKGLDLGTLANLVPGVAFTGAPPKGSLSATLDVRELPLAAPQRAALSLVLEALDLQRDGNAARLLSKTQKIELSGDELKVPDLSLEVRLASGLALTVVAGGVVHKATTAPDLDASARLDQVDLGKLSADIPSVDRVGGTLSANLHAVGPVSSPRISGKAELRKGELAIKGVPVALSDVNVDVEIAGGDARLHNASARVGGGTVALTGHMPLVGPDAFSFNAGIAAHGVKVPVSDGITLTADADLIASYRQGTDEHGQRSLPDVKGTVELTNFSYTRPVALNLNLTQLGRPQRTNVETYDPANDVVRFNVNLVSPRPLRFRNNLMEMDLEVMSPGLVLSGTNQRFGARGVLRVLPDSKVTLRSNDFLVREGFVRFDDPNKIAPKVDVRATTEYRRYASASAGAEQAPTGGVAGATDSSGATSAPGSSISAAASTSQAGIWRITLAASGPVDSLKVLLSSDPPLSQEDIVLLLTIGMTRAELDRGQAQALGETVGLEALSALTGADKAVKTIVPLIDEFRFGTGYSPRTARTEPTVTVGKRITDNVRATVTTGVSEDREIRSNIEWRLNRSMSVQGSYDNLNDVSSSPIGNVGVDLRWRLDFE